MKRTIAMLAALVLLAGSAGSAAAGPVNVITNGGFETGNFSGWTVGSTQTQSFTANFNDGQNAQIVNNAGGGQAWFLRNVSENYFGTAATAITNYTAFNGFDGNPGLFFLRQSFTLAGSLSAAQLQFTFGTQSNYSGVPRVFDVNILDTSNNILGNVYTFTLPTSSFSTWSPATVTEDISGALDALGAGSYQLEFRETIPQTFTGPATFGIDNVSLNVTPAAAAAPEPASLTLLGIGAVCSLGYGWRRRKQAKA